ncbi:GntR family transcriptional regulator [Glutamicibacter sp. NPDC087344]|uniref:GntR family transcriptional regulator n=1 Tax=Glutamicibacter sp. NPDC087344 TaxID=3363994 RepID=UPI003827801F
MSASELQRRGSQSKADIAYAHIKQQIENGTLAPHQRVLAGPLAHELGVSGVPVREAIQRLAAEGLLQIIHNVGARVAVIDERAYRDGMETLAVMDGTATALAASHLREADLKKAEQVNEQIVAMLDSFDQGAYGDLNAQFHAILHSKCPNDRILELTRSEWKKFASIQDPGANVDEHRARGAVEEHRALLALIREGAPIQEIEMASRRHVLSSLEARTKHQSRLM